VVWLIQGAACLNTICNSLHHLRHCESTIASWKTDLSNTSLLLSSLLHRRSLFQPSWL